MTKSGDYIETVKWRSTPQHTVCPFRVPVLQQTACSGMRSTNGMPLLGRLRVICWEYKKRRARFTTLPTTHTFLPPHTRIHANHAHTTSRLPPEKLQLTWHQLMQALLLSFVNGDLLVFFRKHTFF